MGFAAGRFFVEETFGGKSKEKGTKVIMGESLMHLLQKRIVMRVLGVVKAFKASLPNLKWMDSESATAAAEKVSVVDLAI